MSDDASQRVFQTPATAWFVSLAALSLVAFLLFAVFGDELVTPPSSGADSFSRSAIGHKAFVEWMRRLDIEVVVSRARSAAKAGTDALLVLVEPDPDDLRRERTDVLDEALERRGPLLVVLPKRSGIGDPMAPGRLAEVGLLDVSEPQAIARRLVPGGHVLRPSAVGRWRSETMEGTPTLQDPQLLAPAPYLAPIVLCDQGILVARSQAGSADVWILSDPDLLETHGLATGENPVLLANLLAAALPPGGTVVLDETGHGHGITESVWRELFRFPLVLSLVSALLAAGIGLWAAFGRPRVVAPPPPPIEAGKRVLIENTADLLVTGGHHALSLDRALRSAVQAAARSVHVPAGLPPSAVTEWLQRAEAARGVEPTLSEVEAEVARVRTGGRADPRAVLSAARLVHAWRTLMTEMPYGPRRRP